MTESEKTVAYICQGCGGIYWAEVNCDCNTKAAFNKVLVSASSLCGPSGCHSMSDLFEYEKELCAFPFSFDLEDRRVASTGMTLRDYFAAKAMRHTVDNETPFSLSAKLAYEIADEMIKARPA